MPIFLILIVWATLESLYVRRKRIKYILSLKNILLFFSISVFLVWWMLIYPHESMRDLILWVWEKQHGIPLPIALVILGVLTTIESKQMKKYITYTIIMTGVIVSILALIEGLFQYNIFTGGDFMTQWSWGAVRSTSTLGNPNYVAGYLLMILPLVLSIRRIEKYWILFMLILGILMTKSLIGISLVWVFLVFLTLRKYGGKKYLTIFALSILCWFLGLYLGYYDSEKWLSLTSRFILMKHTLMASFDTPLWILWGHGPDSIIRLYKEIRPFEIAAYFPENTVIDSSHNIFIDIFIKYGALSIIGIIYWIGKHWKALDQRSQYALILGAAFFSLNVVVISHYILYIFLLSKNLPKEEIISEESESSVSAGIEYV
jgi:hypothetical protein